MFDDRTVAESFPDCDPGIKPTGTLVLIQIRTPMSKTKGGIIITQDTKDTELWNTRVGRLTDVGPLAFHHRTDRTPWPEGAWCAVGDFIKVKQYIGDRWMVPIKDGATDLGDHAMFVMCNDLDICGILKKGVHPNDIRAWL